MEWKERKKRREECDESGIGEGEKDVREWKRKQRKKMREVNKKCKVPYN